MARNNPFGPLSNLLDRLVRDGSLRGGSIGIVRSGDTPWVRHFGTVTVARDARAPRAADRYLLTSVTKTFTTAQVLRLVEDGQLSLTTPLATLVPEFATKGKEQVLLWHVLTHTSGIDDRVANTAEGPASSRQREDHRRMAFDAPLGSPPGSRVAYCSVPFWVLETLIERVSGVSMAEHLRTEVLTPLELAATGYAPDNPPENYVDAHISDPHYRHLAEQVRGLAYPAGGIITTMTDLLAYGQAWLPSASGGTARHQLLSPATRVQASRSWTDGLPGARDYEGGWFRTQRTLGWALGGPGDLRPDETLWHSGGSGTSLWIDPVHGAVIGLLTATWFLDRDLLGRISNAAVAALTNS